MLDSDPAAQDTLDARMDLPEIAAYLEKMMMSVTSKAVHDFLALCAISMTTVFLNSWVSKAVDILLSSRLNTTSPCYPSPSMF
jgi:hypothetical protein